MIRFFFAPQDVACDVAHGIGVAAKQADESFSRSFADLLQQGLVRDFSDCGDDADGR